MGKGQQKTLLIAAIFFGGMIAGVVIVLLLQNRPQPAPDTLTLRNALQTTAQNSMEVPSLSDANLQLVIDKSKLNQEIDRIKQLAEKFGGTAIQGILEIDGAELLAQIPPRFRNQFVEAAQDPLKEEPAGDQAPEATGAILIGIRLKFAP
jgi:hypothetical protein